MEVSRRAFSWCGKVPAPKGILFFQLWQWYFTYIDQPTHLHCDLQGQVIHYQIQRKGEDALFTLSEQKKISHGLDSLVDYYMNEKQTGLQHSLTDWVQGILCGEFKLCLS